MRENKTRPESQDPHAFIAAIEDERKRADAIALLEIMSEVSAEPATMWGPSMIGFGQWRYRYDSGHEGDWFLTGFSPRASALSIYIPGGFDDLEDQLGRLGKHRIGKGCLYVKSLSDVDLDVLREVIRSGCEWARSSRFRVDATEREP